MGKDCSRTGAHDGKVVGSNPVDGNGLNAKLIFWLSVLKKNERKYM